jgi:NTP pyrophosphatase (non-canonical NTP hydrolase)
MTGRTLRQLQADIDGWTARNGGYWDEFSLLARLTEEVGELAREYNHRFGAKRKKTSEPERALEDELADVLWIVLCMANQQGIDLDAAFGRTMEKLTSRDGERFVPARGE